MRSPAAWFVTLLLFDFNTIQQIYWQFSNVDLGCLIALRCSWGWITNPVLRLILHTGPHTHTHTLFLTKPAWSPVAVVCCTKYRNLNKYFRSIALPGIPVMNRLLYVCLKRIILSRKLKCADFSSPQWEKLKLTQLQKLAVCLQTTSVCTFQQIFNLTLKFQLYSQHDQWHIFLM